MIQTNYKLQMEEKTILQIAKSNQNTSQEEQNHLKFSSSYTSNGEQNMSSTNNSHFYNISVKSYVDLNVSFEENKIKQSALCETGDSLYNKLWATNQGNTFSMQNKKIQCSIANVNCYKSQLQPQKLERKIAKLQIMKTMKLVNLIFRHLRDCHFAFYREAQIQKARRNQLFENFSIMASNLEMSWKRQHKKYQDRIQQLSQDNQNLLEQKKSLQRLLNQLQIDNKTYVQGLIHLLSKKDLKIQQKMESLLKNQEKLQQMKTKLLHQDQKIINYEYLLNSSEIEIERLHYSENKFKYQNLELQERLKSYEKQLEQLQIRLEQQSLIIEEYKFNEGQREYQEKIKQSSQVKIQPSSITSEIEKELGKLTDYYQDLIKQKEQKWTRIIQQQRKKKLKTDNVGQKKTIGKKKQQVKLLGRWKIQKYLKK